MNYGWRKEPLLPVSPRMNYGQMRMALYRVAPDLQVSSALLPGKLDGIYCLATNTVLIDRRMTYVRKRCALVHGSSIGGTAMTLRTGARAARSNADVAARPQCCSSTQPRTP